MRLGHNYLLFIFSFNTIHKIRVFGGNSEEEIPVPIPNTEVKLFSADGTAWGTAWESRSPPRFFIPLINLLIRGFLSPLLYPKFKSPHSYWIIDSNDTAAVSARNILFPKETMRKPASFARLISFRVKPPSGPTIAKT